MTHDQIIDVCKEVLGVSQVESLLEERATSLSSLVDMAALKLFYNGKGCSDIAVLVMQAHEILNTFPKE